jgi:hypothetical protein
MTSEPVTSRHSKVNSTQERSKGRRVAFRVWAVLTSLLFLVLFGFGAFELGLMWLPDQTLASMFDEPPNLPVHRTHFLIVGIISWAFLLATFVQLRKPERRVASMLQLVVMVLGGTVVYAYSGTLGEWLSEEWIVLVPVLVLALLHPKARDLVANPGFDRKMTLLAGIAMIPWLAFIVDTSRLQLINAAGDAHAEMEHWATAALFGITIVACAIIGSTDHRGWRMPAWIAVAASMIFGIHSLVFPGRASGLTTAWAVAAVIWGMAFAATILRRVPRAQDSATT